MHLYDGELNEMLIIDGTEYKLSSHVKLRIKQRNIKLNWIADVLTNWVARKYMIEHNSMNYFGIIPGRNSLFMVAVSEYSPVIASAYFNSAATARYYGDKYNYFDEVRL